MTKVEKSQDGKEQVRRSQREEDVLTPHGHGPTGYRIVT